jgi:hypothetical protein
MPNIPVAIGDIAGGVAQMRFDRAVHELRACFADIETAGKVGKIKMEFIIESVTEDYVKIGVGNVSVVKPALRQQSGIAFFDEDGTLTHDEADVAPGDQAPIRYPKEV